MQLPRRARRAPVGWGGSVGPYRTPGARSRVYSQAVLNCNRGESRMPSSPVPARLRELHRHLARAVPAAAADDGGATLITTADEISEIAFGFMGSKALFSALDTELFEHIAASGDGLTTAALHAQLKNNDLFLAKTNMKYDYGDYLRYQIDKQMFPFMSHLNAIMKGETSEQKFEDYQEWMSDPEEARLYTESQHSGSIGPAIALARKEKERLSAVRSLLDVGGGSGGFSMTLAQHFPEMHCTVMDFDNVCTVGADFLAKQSTDVAARVSFTPGNALTSELPPGQDAILLSYLCGSVPADSLPGLYTRCVAALNPGGLLIVHDFMVENSMDGPKLSALWALQHMIFVPGGVGLTPGLVGGMMLEAGFSHVETAEHIPGMTKRVIGVKAA